MSRARRLLPVLLLVMVFPGCGQAAQHQRPIPKAPSPAEADRLAVDSATAFLDGRPTGRSHHPVTLVAAAAAAQANGYRDNAALLLHDAAALQRSRSTYYGAAWTALGRLLLTTHRLQSNACAI